MSGACLVDVAIIQQALIAGLHADQVLLRADRAIVRGIGVIADDGHRAPEAGLHQILGTGMAAGPAADDHDTGVRP